jgi:hypothetical protein
MFGMPQNQYEKLSLKEKRTVARHYHERLASQQRRQETGIHKETTHSHTSPKQCYRDASGTLHCKQSSSSSTTYFDFGY